MIFMAVSLIRAVIDFDLIVLFYMDSLNKTRSIFYIKVQYIIRTSSSVRVHTAWCGSSSAMP